jgi:acetyltransferase-like isoleucine patch superfamily enzyme
MKNLLILFPHIIIALLPSRIKIFIFTHIFSAQIHPSARIGFSLIKVKKLVMGENSSIGHFNSIRGLDLLQLGSHAVIRNANTLSAMPLAATKQFFSELNRFPAFILGEHSAVIKGHFFDCNNTITIGHHSIIAGISSVFFTHGINIDKNRQESSPITIGDYCMVGARCVITKGASLPNNCVLGSNSTLHKAFTQCHTLYSGVPALAVKSLSEEAEFFHRKIGYVQ